MVLLWSQNCFLLQKCNIKRSIFFWFRIRWKSCQKKLTAKKWQKMAFLTFAVCKSYQPITSLGWTFLNFFFYVFGLSIWFLHFMVPIPNFGINAFLLILARFANFKANQNETAEKNEKHILYCKCGLDSHFTSIFGVWEAPFCQKKVKDVVPYYSIQLMSDDNN